MTSWDSQSQEQMAFDFGKLDAGVPAEAENLDICPGCGELKPIRELMEGDGQCRTCVRGDE